MKTYDIFAQVHKFKTLILQWFQVRITLFSKYFAPFPRGTCSLSVSRMYWASGQIYDRICDPIPGNTTLQECEFRKSTLVQNRIFTFHTVASNKHARVAHYTHTRIQQSEAGTSVLYISFFLFIRHYLENPMWFFFLHLLICLNSVGNYIRDHAEFS